MWSAAAVALLLGTLFTLFCLTQLLRSLGESFCGEPGRLPADAGGWAGPSWVGPVTWRCDYGSHGVLDFTAYQPLVLVAVAGVVYLTCAAAVAWAAHRLTRPR